MLSGVTFSLLHYDVDIDTGFCHLCMRCEAEHLTSIKREPAITLSTPALCTGNRDLKSMYT